MLLLAAAVIWSPYATGWLGGSGSQWREWALRGEAFGFAGALVAGVGLLVIAFQQRQQAEEARIAGLQADREAQVALLRMQADNRNLLGCWGASELDDDPFTRERHDYVNMIFTKWEISHEGKRMGDVAVRNAAAEAFTTEINRAYWASSRDDRFGTSETKRALRFHRIVDEEYRKAIAGPPGVTEAQIRAQIRDEAGAALPADSSSPPPNRDTAHHDRAASVAVTLAALAAGYAIGHTLRRRS